MTRVGFIVARQASGWIGGISYLRNLLSAVRAAECEIEPVVIAPPGEGAAIAVTLGADNFIESDIADLSSRAFKIGRFTKRLLARDLLLERLLRTHRIEILSHSGAIGSKSTIPAICWIPDFQHRRMPQFFSEKEKMIRDAAISRLARDSRVLLLSSEDARRDLAAFRPGAERKSRVLRFVAGVQEVQENSKARIPAEPFLLLPNQFWKHKNHAAVIRALGILRRRGNPVRVVATGLMEDYRHPDHVQRIRALICAEGVEQDFEMRGVVPYAELGALYRAAAAIINPSYFEGWSTSVEEAKSLGKRMLLSDIPVHREQAPARGHYFAPDDVEAIAEAFATALAEYDPEKEAQWMARAAESLPERVRNYGRAFGDIVRDALDHNGRLRHSK